MSFNFANNSSQVLYLGGLRSIVIGGAFPRWGSEVSVQQRGRHVLWPDHGFGYKNNAKGQRLFNSAGEPEQSDSVIAWAPASTSRRAGSPIPSITRTGSLSALIDFKYGAKIYSGTNLLLYNYGLQKTTLQGREGGFVGKGVNDAGAVNTKAVPASDLLHRHFCGRRRSYRGRIRNMTPASSS